MLPLRSVRGLVAAAALLVSAGQAAAEPSTISSIEGKTQLQLQTSLMEYVSLRTKPENDPDAPKDETNELQLGLASRLGLGVGFALSNNLQVHFLGGFALRTHSANLTDSYRRSSLRGTQYEFMPSLRYVGTEASRTRLYMGVGFGMLGARLRDDELTLKSRTFQVGATFGAYRFVTRHLSIDPGIELSYLKTTTRLSELETDLSSNGGGLRALFTLGLSGWFGGDEHDADALVPTNWRSAPEILVSRGHVARLALELRGNPQVQGNHLAVQLTHRQADLSWEGCSAALVSDRGAHPLGTDPVKRSEGHDGALETLSASETVETLELWLAERPRVRVCGEAVELPASLTLDFIQLLTRFKSEAERVGTRLPGRAAQVAPTPPPHAPTIASPAAEAVPPSAAPPPPAAAPETLPPDAPAPVAP